MAANRLTLLVCFASVLLPGRSYGEQPSTSKLIAGSLVEVRASGLLRDEPLGGLFKVDAQGKIVLGPAYGNVKIVGLMPEEAASAITLHLRKIVRNPQVSVDDVTGDQQLQVQAVLRGLGPNAAPAAAALLSSRDMRLRNVLAAGDLLEIRAAPKSTLVDQPIAGLYRVNFDGAVILGPSYGNVRIAGLSRDQAKAAIDKHLRSIIREPDVTVEYVGDSVLLQKQAIVRAFGASAAPVLLGSN